MKASVPDNEFASALRGFGPLGILAILVIILTGRITISNIVIPVGALLILVWANLSHTPWRDIGYGRPKNWAITIVLGIILGILFKLVMKSVVMPLLGAEPVNQAFHFLAGNKTMLPFAIWAMLMAGFAEETFFRGYLFERLRKLLGKRKLNIVVIILFTSAWFGVEHYKLQGDAGVQQGIIAGLLYGTIYAITGRIWVIMIAHATFDLTSLALIYWELEEEVARWFW